MEISLFIDEASRTFGPFETKLFSFIRDEEFKDMIMTCPFFYDYSRKSHLPEWINLIEYDNPLKVLDTNGNTAFHLASRDDLILELFYFILMNKNEKDNENRNGTSMKNIDKEDFRHLPNHIFFNNQNKHGFTPMDIYLYQSNVNLDILRLLSFGVSYGEYQMSIYFNGKSAHLDLDIITFLGKDNTHFTYINSRGMSLLHLYLHRRENNPAIIKYLSRRCNLSYSVQNKANALELYLGLGGSELKIVKYLSRGIDMSRINSSGLPILLTLHHYFGISNPKIIRYLKRKFKNSS